MWSTISEKKKNLFILEKAKKKVGSEAAVARKWGRSDTLSANFDYLTFDGVKQSTEKIQTKKYLFLNKSLCEKGDRVRHSHFNWSTKKVAKKYKEDHHSPWWRHIMIVCYDCTVITYSMVTRRWVNSICYSRCRYTRQLSETGVVFFTMVIVIGTPRLTAARRMIIVKVRASRGVVLMQMQKIIWRHWRRRILQCCIAAGIHILD